MLQDLWAEIRGHWVRPAGAAPRELPQEPDAPDLLAEIDGPPDYEAEPVAGLLCQIVYRDIRGVETVRRITCQRIDLAGGASYVVARCHEREARRQFRIDRMVRVADLSTGEVSDDPPGFFRSFAIDRRQETTLGWGLSVRRRADLVAGLNCLVFMARCDREWHPLERAEIEPFVTAFWLRSEAPGEPPMRDILAHADRLSPDAETFFIALQRCASRPVLARTIRRHLEAVAHADGRLSPEEAHWGRAVDDYFRSIGG